MPQVFIKATLRGMDGKPIVGVTVDAIVSPYDPPPAPPTNVCGTGVTGAAGSVVFAGELSKPNLLPRFRLRRQVTGANGQVTHQVIAEIAQSWSWNIQPAIGRAPVIDFGTVTTSVNPLFTIGDTPFYGLHADALVQLFALAQADLLPQIAILVSANNQLSGVNKTLLAELSKAQADIAALQKTITELQAEFEACKARIGQSTTVDSVLQGLGEQLKFAQAALASAQTPFKVGKLSATIKGIPSPDGTSLIFPTLDQLKDIDGLLLSDITFDFAADAEATRLVEPPPGAVPKVVGMTEVFAARTLQNAGFQSKTSYQTVTAPKQGAVSLIGRVIKQLPVAGSTADPGSTITLFVGKALV
jgi:hypothetical protein